MVNNGNKYQGNSSKSPNRHKFLRQGKVIDVVLRKGRLMHKVPAYVGEIIIVVKTFFLEQESVFQKTNKSLLHLTYPAARFQQTKQNMSWKPILEYFWIILEESHLQTVMYQLKNNVVVWVPLGIEFF